MKSYQGNDNFILFHALIGDGVIIILSYTMEVLI